MSRRHARVRGGEGPRPAGDGPSRHDGHGAAPARTRWMPVLLGGAIAAGVWAWTLTRERLPVLPAVGTIAAHAEPALAAAL